MFHKKSFPIYCASWALYFTHSWENFLLEQSFYIVRRNERLEIVDLLAHADVFHRNAQLRMDGHGDTGFGLLIHFDGNDEAMAEAKTLRPGDFVSVTGEIVPAGKAYFYIGNVTELRRSSEKEGFPGGES